MDRTVPGQDGTHRFRRPLARAHNLNQQQDRIQNTNTYVFQLNESKIPSDTDSGSARNVKALNWLICPQARGRSLVLATCKQYA